MADIGEDDCDQRANRKDPSRPAFSRTDCLRRPSLSPADSQSQDNSLQLFHIKLLVILRAVFH